MAFEKVVEAKLLGVTNQNSTVRLTCGESTGGTFTEKANPLRGSVLWDRAMFVLQGVSVAGGATGGSYTITLETDHAVPGFTALPVSDATVIGPASPKTVVLSNAHDSPCAPTPTHVRITQDAAGGGIWFQLHAIAKQYRGTLSTQGSNSSERVIRGQMIGFGETAVDGQTMTTSSTWALNGASASTVGMNRMRLWDNAVFWITGATVSGEWSAAVISNVGGTTVTISNTAASAVTTAGDKVALQNSFFGQCPNPTAVIITEDSAGTLNGNVLVLAKSGRGTLAKH